MLWQMECRKPGGLKMRNPPQISITLSRTAEDELAEQVRLVAQNEIAHARPLAVTV